MWNYNLLDTNIIEDKILISKYVNKWGKTWYMTNKNKWNTAITYFIDLQEYGQTKEESIKKIIDRLYNYTEAKNEICYKVKQNPEMYDKF